MPTVGCEADAVAFTEDKSVSGGASGVTILWADEQGAYIAAPSGLGQAGGSNTGSGAGGAATEAVVEVAIPLSTPTSSAVHSASGRSTMASLIPPAPRQRVRLLHRLQRASSGGDAPQWSCKEVEVHFEKWAAPHRAGG
jgi:hypothetical protein